MQQLPLILGSGSVRRLEYLRMAGYQVDKVLVADTDESSLPKEKPKDYAKRVTIDKMQAIAPQAGSAFVITADTTAVCRGKILHKTDDDMVLRKYLKDLSGRRHTVYTAVCCAKVINGTIEKMRSKISESVVQFRLLTEKEIEHYIATKEGRRKAGGCTLQGISSRYIKFISGSSSGIVGLPLYETTLLLDSVGYKCI